ncbi:MAG: hypothetical protein EHM41_24015 [Chloroflexi bacterium]|nr:MAG: hypothetical protein EHM41_24015 [Chloroflexota bacterium]
MAQLRHDYQKFKALNTEVLVMVPNGSKLIGMYVHNNPTPYPILSDKGSKVAAQYLQIRKFHIAGTPSVFLVNKTGKICYAHYSTSLIEEPDNRVPLALLAQQNSS